MESIPVDTISYSNFKAEVFSVKPGEFNVVYCDASGQRLEETPITGVSTYRQREPEIRERLQQLANGAKPETTPDQGDAGEY